MRKMDGSIYGSSSKQFPETIVGNVSRIAKKCGIKMVILHGSILAGKVHSNSDVQDYNNLKVYGTKRYIDYSNFFNIEKDYVKKFTQDNLDRL